MKKFILFFLLLVSNGYAAESATYIDSLNYIIKEPGTYILRQDILWQALDPDSFAITIACDNVILDGDGRTIKQKDPATKHAICVQVKEGIKNVTIQNMTLDSFSGGGIWFRGANEQVVVKGVKMANCGYNGMTQLDALESKSYGILFDGGHKRPITNAQVIDCLFVEIGILRSIKPTQFEANSSAIHGYHCKNVTIKGSTIDGCVARDSSSALAFIDISNLLLSDVFITDIFAQKKAVGIFTDDVDGEVQDCPQTGILSNIPPTLFGYYLDTHPSAKENVAEDDAYVIQACHFKGVVPSHAEKEPLLYNEHKWREFRTLGRLVSYNSHLKSKTSAIYAKWVELFCERVLAVKVQVVGGFANLYLNGDTPLPAHRDQYKKWVFGLSFGETRNLEFVPDNPRKTIISYPMEAGDVFLFAPDVNNRYQHRMLAEPKRTGRRINITYFLDILPGQETKKLLNPPIFKKEAIPTFEEAEALYNQ